MERAEAARPRGRVPQRLIEPLGKVGGAIRRRIRRLSFRQRLILLSTVAVAIAVVMASGIMFVVVRNELRGQVDDDLRDLVGSIVVPAQTPGGSSVVLPADPLGRRTGYAQLVQPNGSVLRPPGETVNLPVDSRTIKAASGQSGAFFADQRIGGVHVRVLTTPLPAGGGPSAGAVQAVKPLEDVDRSLRNLAFALIAVSLGGIALAVSLGRVVARTALTPVVQLTNTAEWVARTRDLSRRMDSSGSDELSRLGASFNTMLEALDDSQKAQRQLVADASHELRTPLTSLRTNIEVLENVDLLSVEDRSRLLRDIVAQLEELTVLVSDLVDLARGVQPDFDTEEVRLDALASEAVERARRHAHDRHFALDVEPTLVRGVPARIDRAISNLLDNAAKWSPPGGTIDVTVRDGEVAVRDHGPGIEHSDLPLIFERFYRASSARGLPGSGLGLAIVRQVAESHGGGVSAETPRGGGALFRLRLPALDRDAAYAGDERPA